MAPGHSARGVESRSCYSEAIHKPTGDAAGACSMQVRRVRLAVFLVLLAVAFQRNAVFICVEICRKDVAMAG